MKGRKKNGILPDADEILEQTNKSKQIIYLSLTILFFISFMYFLVFGHYVFFYQENFRLFIFTNEFLQQFTVKPGGLLEYAGIFLSQGFFNNLYGAVLFSTILIIITVIYLSIFRKLLTAGSFSIAVVLIPACLLLFMQTNLNWFPHYNLGLILTLCYFLITISSDKRSLRILSLALFPLFFYITGAYAWVFLVMYISYSVIYENWVSPLLFLLVSALTFLIFREFLFLQPDKLLFTYGLPSKSYFQNPVFFYLVSAVIIFYPVLIRSFYLNQKRIHKRTDSLIPIILTYAFTLVILFNWHYDINTARLIKLEKYLYAGDWNKLIREQEKNPSGNLISQYYYNLALSERGILCDRMFYGPQDYGPQSILIPWDSKAGINNIYRGVYFYYTLGLINEAHRWAFESMVSQGYRPENLKMLVKTNLINGHYKIAEKYINILKKTLHYRKWVNKYEQMLFNTELIKADPELGDKLRLQPKKDFSIQIKSPQSNVLFMLQANPENEKAFEYKMAWYLLEKNIPAVVNEIDKLKDYGYNKIPKHIEEAAVVFAAINGQMISNFRGLAISKETQDLFARYGRAMLLYRGNMKDGKYKMQKPLINTLWYFLDFK